MKKLIVLAFVAALALPAVAGSGESEYRCSNSCPLAQQANTHRATGAEAQATSAVVRADVTRAVARNLARI